MAQQQSIQAFDYNIGIDLDTGRIPVSAEGDVGVAIPYFHMPGISKAGISRLVVPLVSHAMSDDSRLNMLATYVFNRYPALRGRFQSMGRATLSSIPVPAGLMTYLDNNIKPGGALARPAVVGTGTENDPEIPAVAAAAGILRVAEWGTLDLTLSIEDTDEADFLSGMVLLSLVRLLNLGGRDQLVGSRTTSGIRQLAITDVADSIFRPEVVNDVNSWVGLTSLTRTKVSARQSILKTVLMDVIRARTDDTRLMRATIELLAEDGMRNFDRVRRLVLFGTEIINNDHILRQEAFIFAQQARAFAARSKFDRVFGKAIAQADIFVFDRRLVPNLVGVARMYASASSAGLTMAGVEGLHDTVATRARAKMQEMGLAVATQT